MRYFLILTLLLFISCSTNINSILKEIEKVEDYETEQKLAEKLLEHNYTNIRITQKIVLTMRNRQYDFVTYIAFVSSDKFRIIFLTDMGNTVLDFIYSYGNLNVISNLSGIPDKLILNGLYKDIQHIYGSVLSGNNSAELYTQENEYLLIRSNKENTEIFYFDEDDDENISESLYSDDNIIVSNVHYSNYIDNIPQKISVENFRYDYAMEIQLLEMSTLKNTERIFDVR